VIAIVALITMTLLPLSMCRHPCYCQAGIIALVTMVSLPLIRNGVVALVAMTLLPSSSRRCCPCCNDDVVIIKRQASLPSSRWGGCPRHNGVVAIDVQVFLPPIRAREGVRGENRIELNRRITPGQPRTLGTPLLLALRLTTKPLRRRNGLVVKRNANRLVPLLQWRFCHS
jgi:hypothetical protein